MAIVLVGDATGWHRKLIAIVLVGDVTGWHRKLVAIVLMIRDEMPLAGIEN